MDTGFIDKTPLLTAHLSDPRFRDFVTKHAADDPSRLRLDWHNRIETAGFDVNDAILQVECRQRFGRKLSTTLERFPDFYFPSALAGEQATSDLLAGFHTRFVDKDDVLVDLTAGLGIDCARLAGVCRAATAVERTEHTAEALRYNLDGLGLGHVRVVRGDCRDALKTLEGTIAFIDPARRAADGRRVFGLADCEPDVVTMLPEISKRFERLVIKASPMLDITRMLAEVPGISDIYALGTTTECRELDAIVVFGNETASAPIIHAVTMIADDAYIDFAFALADEADAKPLYAQTLPKAGDILYEPYPATMKAAPFRLLASRFSITKFSANTHLYFGTATSVAYDFPGEQFDIVEVIPWQSKHIKRLASRYPRISLTVRNFGMTANDLRRKLGVSDGGELRLFAVSTNPVAGRRQTSGGSSVGDRLLIVARPR